MAEVPIIFLRRRANNCPILTGKNPKSLVFLHSQSPLYLLPFLLLFHQTPESRIVGRNAKTCFLRCLAEPSPRILLQSRLSPTVILHAVKEEKSKHETPSHPLSGVTRFCSRPMAASQKLELFSEKGAKTQSSDRWKLEGQPWNRRIQRRPKCPHFPSCFGPFVLLSPEVPVCTITPGIITG